MKPPHEGFIVYRSLMCNFQNETPLGQIKDNEMKKNKFLILTIFIFSFVNDQE